MEEFEICVMVDMQRNCNGCVGYLNTRNCCRCHNPNPHKSKKQKNKKLCGFRQIGVERWCEDYESGGYCTQLESGCVYAYSEF